MKAIGKFLFALGLVGAMALAAGPAGAVLIGFDNIAPGTIIDGVNLGGVTLTSPGGVTQVIAGNSFQVGYRSQFNSVTNFSNQGNFVTAVPIVLTFDLLQDFVSVVGGDQGGDFDKFTIEAFDATDNLLATFTTPFFGGNNPLNPNIMIDHFTAQFDLGIPVIKKLVISDAQNLGIGIDNLDFHNVPVPIPSAALLFGSGLLGLLGIGRRKFRSR